MRQVNEAPSACLIWSLLLFQKAISCHFCNWRFSWGALCNVHRNMISAMLLSRFRRLLINSEIVLFLQCDPMQREALRTALEWINMQTLFPALAGLPNGLIGSSTSTVTKLFIFLRTHVVGKAKTHSVINTQHLSVNPDHAWDILQSNTAICTVSALTAIPASGLLRSLVCDLI